MVEYGILVAQTSMASISALSADAHVWISRINWEIVSYGALCLVALRIASWAFKTR
jgi:hypothetical protein